MGTPRDDYILVAAIDFGPDYTGCLFSTRHRHSIDPLQVCGSTWGAGCRMSFRAPTCVLFDSNKKFHSFGFEAEDYYSDFALDDKHQNFYFFRRFKMKLFNNLHLKRTFMLEDEMGKKMSAIDVFSACIKYLKDRVVKQWAHMPDLTVYDIRWVLTVPAVWNDVSKQFMREAAKEAGIIDEQLMIALEPEAGSIYCQHLPMIRLEGTHGGFVPFAPGSKYLVLDASGGTVDITVHEVQPSGSLKELYKANGRNWETTYLDLVYRNLLADIIGNDIMDDFQATQTMDYNDFFIELQSKKKTFQPEMNKNINIRLPIYLQDDFQKRKGKSLKEHVKTKYDKSITWIGDSLRIEAHIAKGMFEEACGSVAKHLKALFAKEQVHDIPTILMVGGFSGPPMLQDIIRKTMPDKTFIIPDEQDLAVLIGAVIYGHNQSVIHPERYTSEVISSVPFKASVHPDAKKFVDDDRNLLCADIFDIFGHVML